VTTLASPRGQEAPARGSRGRRRRRESGPPAPPEAAGLIPSLVVLAVAALLAATAGFERGVLDGDPRLAAAAALALASSFVLARALRPLGVPETATWVLVGIAVGPAMAPLVPPFARPAPLGDGLLSPPTLGALGPLAAGALWLASFGGAEEAGRGPAGTHGLRGVVALVAAQLLAALGVAVLVGLGLPWLADAGRIPVPVPNPWGPALLVGAAMVAGSPAILGSVVQGQRAEGIPSRAVARASVLQLLLFAALGSFLVVDQRRPPFALPAAMLAGLLLGMTIGPLFVRVPRGRVALLAAVLLGVGAGAELLRWPAVPLLVVGGLVSTIAARGGPTVASSFTELSFPVRGAAFTLLGAALLPDLTRLPWVAAAAGAVILVRTLASTLALQLGLSRLGDLDGAFARLGAASGFPRAELVVPFGLGLASSPEETAALTGRVILAVVALDSIVGPFALRALFREADDGPELGPAPVPRPSLPPGRGGSGPEDPFGETPTYADARLTSELRDLRFDLERAAEELRGQLFAVLRQDADNYLRDLRREFLRHHRRVVVRARTADSEAEITDELRAQQSELADRFRGIVLRRSAALSRSGRFRASQVFESFDRVIGATPEVLRAPVEDITYRRRPGDTLLRRAGRFLLRRRRAFADAVGVPGPKRRIPLRRLVRHHLIGLGVPGLEGTLAVVLEEQTGLVARTRSLFDGVIRGYDAFASGETTDEDALLDRLETLRQDTEDELSFCLTEADRMETEGVARWRQTLGTVYRKVAREAGQIGTLDLPSRERTDPRPSRRMRRQGEALLDRFQGGERAVAAGFGLLALELELVGLEARLKEALAQTFDELAGDVRGRAAVQAERVAGALGDAAGSLREELETGASHPGADVGARVREAAETVEKVVGEAARAGAQLRDQLLSESTIAPFLDAFRRAAAGLAERYEVPDRPILRGEWQVPNPPGVVDVPFRDLVTAHIEATVAPRLLEVVRDLGGRLEPLLGSLAELERRLAFNVELATADLEIQPDEPIDEAARNLLEEMIGTTLEKNQELLRSHARDAEGWPDELRERLGDAVLRGVQDLRRQLLDGEVSDLRLQLLRQSPVGRRLVRGAEALPSKVARARRELFRAVRRLVGEDRIDTGRRILGLPSGLERAPVDPEVFAPPRSPSDRVPLVYRRLFSPESLEAGDVLTGREEEIARGVSGLSGGLGAPGRKDGTGPRGGVVALIGLDGVGKGAVASAIVRGARFKQPRRHRFAGPVAVDDLAEVFPTGTGQLVVVRGLHWLASARPGGLDPLRHFTERLVADGGRNAFLLQADAVVWTYLVGLSGLGDATGEVIHLAPLDRESLRAAVLARHRLSGLGLTFDPGSEGGVEDALLRAAGRLRRPYDSYFRRLHAASGGLVRDALRLWLASIEHVDGKADLVQVGPVPDSALPALRALPEDALVPLYTIARSGWIDAATYAHLFRVDETRAAARLARLERWGLLQVKGGLFRITVHLRGALHRVFQERGWVSTG